MSTSFHSNQLQSQWLTTIGMTLVLHAVACDGESVGSQGAGGDATSAGGSSGTLGGTGGGGTGPNGSGAGGSAGITTSTGMGPCREPSVSFTDKLYAMPDYTQTDPDYGGFANGNNFCGPTAVSNALMYLRNHGYPAIAPMSADAKKDQHDLIVELASAAFMKTDDAFNGTTPNNLTAGLAQYLNSRSVPFFAIEWQGWVPAGFSVPPEYDTGVAIPTLDAIKLGIEGSSVAWLMLGMGESESATTRTISNGHWVTVVAHGVDSNGLNPKGLVLHDPWPNAGPDFYVEANSLGPGQFVVDYPGFDGITFDGTNSLRLDGNWNFPYAEIYVLGLVVLRMENDCL
jgi:hypothetical protein